MVTLSSYSDSRLLDLIRQNNEQALETIFDRYWVQLFDFAFGRVRSVDSSKVIVQEIFVALWLKRRHLSTGNLRDYLYSDAHNRTIEYLDDIVKALAEEKVMT